MQEVIEFKFWGNKVNFKLYTYYIFKINVHILGMQFIFAFPPFGVSLIFAS